MKIYQNYNLTGSTSVAISSRTRYFVVVKSERNLRGAILWANERALPIYVSGEGTNLVPLDQSYPGLFISNQIKKFKRKKNLVTLGAGENLFASIKKIIDLGLSGMEKMAGIPGTIGGAIYGCAGAYGQEVRDCLQSVKIFDGKKFRLLKITKGTFGYRNSIFKKNKTWIIVDATFKFKIGERGELKKIASKIVKMRRKKYPPALKCPGSYFKNIKISELPSRVRAKLLRKIPHEKIIAGKIPVGYLLEKVGAKGMRRGGFCVAKNHGNLIYNTGKGKYRDLRILVRRLKKLVKTRFGITIEEEVQYLK